MQQTAMMFNSPNKLLAGIEAARAINGRNLHEDLMSGRGRQIESRSMNNGAMRPIKKLQNNPHSNEEQSTAATLSSDMPN